LSGTQWQRFRTCRSWCVLYRLQLAQTDRAWRTRFRRKRRRGWSSNVTTSNSRASGACRDISSHGAGVIRPRKLGERISHGFEDETADAPAVILPLIPPFQVQHNADGHSRSGNWQVVLQLRSIFLASSFCRRSRPLACLLHLVSAREAGDPEPQGVAQQRTPRAKSASGRRTSLQRSDMLSPS
jgi:hypothetical protein